MTWLGQKSDPEPIRSTSTPSPTTTPTSAPTQAAASPAPRETYDRTESNRVANIGKSLHVKGELTGNEDLAIEGKVDGKITLNGHRVTIGTNGRVTAEIHAKSIVVGGEVKGNIVAEERVEIAATGSMLGDVRAPRVILVDGCRFKGSIDMDGKAAAASASVAPAASTSRVAASREEPAAAYAMSEAGS